MKKQLSRFSVFLVALLLVVGVSVTAGALSNEIDISDLYGVTISDNPDENFSLILEEVNRRKSELQMDEYDFPDGDQQDELILEFEYNWISMENINIDIELDNGATVYSDLSAIFLLKPDGEQRELAVKIDGDERNEIALLSASPGNRYITYCKTDYSGTEFASPETESWLMDTENFLMKKLPGGVSQWSLDNQYVVLGTLEEYFGYSVFELPSMNRVNKDHIYGVTAFSPDSSKLAIIHDGGADYQFALSILDLKSGIKKEVQKIEMKTHDPIMYGPFWINSDTVLYTTASANIEKQGSDAVIKTLGHSIKSASVSEYFRGMGIYPISGSPAGDYLLCVGGQETLQLYSTKKQAFANTDITFNDVSAGNILWNYDGSSFKRIEMSSDTETMTNVEEFSIEMFEFS